MSINLIKFQRYQLKVLNHGHHYGLDKDASDVVENIRSPCPCFLTIISHSLIKFNLINYVYVNHYGFCVPLLKKYSTFPCCSIQGFIN